MPELPPELLNSLQGVPGFERDAFARAHSSSNRITSIRINPFKRTELAFKSASPVPWCRDGLYLTERPSFTLDPLFHAGCYYVQEAGSMFLEYAIQQGIGTIEHFNVLDLCAAPGGKSTSLLSLLNGTGALVSNEVVKNRVPALTDNLGRWGLNNSIVTNVDSARFTPAGPLFDLLVADAPCSGSGLFRKQPESIDEWSIEAVQMCSLRQRDILSAALPALKPGGYLFYSTCSYSVEENEEIVKWLVEECGMGLVRLQVPREWGIIDSGWGYRFYPHLTGSEGFFCALLKKSGESRPSTFKARPQKREVALPKSFAGLLNAEKGETEPIQGRLHYVSAPGRQLFQALQEHVYFRKVGVYLGEIKGRDLVPAQDLAWSVDLAFKNALELDEKNALQYLRKLHFEYRDEGLGLRLITYNGFGLGWAKILAGRANNYFPQELRVRM